MVCTQKRCVYYPFEKEERMLMKDIKKLPMGLREAHPIPVPRPESKCNQVYFYFSAFG